MLLLGKTGIISKWWQWIDVLSAGCPVIAQQSHLGQVYVTMKVCVEVRKLHVMKHFGFISAGVLKKIWVMYTYFTLPTEVNSTSSQSLPQNQPSQPVFQSATLRFRFTLRSTEILSMTCSLLSPRQRNKYRNRKFMWWNFQELQMQHSWWSNG